MNHPATPFSELPMSDSSQFPRQLTVKTVSVCCCNSFCHRYLLCNGKRPVLALQLFELTLDFFRGYDLYFFQLVFNAIVIFLKLWELKINVFVLFSCVQLLKLELLLFCFVAWKAHLFRIFKMLFFPENKLLHWSLPVYSSLHIALSSFS